MSKDYLKYAAHFVLLVSMQVAGQGAAIPDAIDNKDFNPATLMWYDSPAGAWEEALPVGNGRLGAMVFGRFGEERIQLNEETYWSGGPYSTVVEGGAEVLHDIQKYLFKGEPLKAHKLFGRYLMGYPVEQQKYQSLAKAPDQVILIRLTASKPGSISFRAQLRGCRNQAHSNYATDYFRKDGTLQEWTEDLEQMEDKHRHFSHMYGLYPGNVISVKNTPQFIGACKAVLEQRGDGGTGFSRGWKMALWARLYDGNRAAKVFKGYIAEQSYPQLFSKCFTPLQIDGTQGVAAGITEMSIQSHEGVIDLLPALPDEWREGIFEGVCARGGFELVLNWKDLEITRVEILSKFGNSCRIEAGGGVSVTKDGKSVSIKSFDDGSIAFNTTKGGIYTLMKPSLKMKPT